MEAYADYLSEHETWEVANDADAEWALTKILENNAEYDRLINVCEQQIEKYASKIDTYKRQKENANGYLNIELAKYFETVKTKETKTQLSYKLPSGTLIKKFATIKLDPDKKTLADYLKANGKYEYLDGVKWAEYKKELQIVNGIVYDNDGQAVECIKVIEKPAEFKVQLKKGEE